MMIRFLYSFREDLRNRNIYIWDIGRNARDVLSRLLYRGVKVKGLVTHDRRFVGGRFLNLPILYGDSLREDPDALLVMHDKTSKWYADRAACYAKTLRYSETLEQNPALAEGEHYLYGIGGGTWDFLKRNDGQVRIKGFLETEQGETASILGLPVKEFHKAGLTEKDSVIVAVRKDFIEREILHEILRRDFRGTVYVRDMLPWVFRCGTDPFYMVDMALREGKRILLCSAEAEGARLLREALELCGISIDREVRLRDGFDGGEEDVWMLADEDPEKSVLLLHALYKPDMADMTDAAVDLGYSEDRYSYAAIQPAYTNRLMLTGQLEYGRDPLIPCNVDYSPVGGMPGWAVYGEERPGALKLMVLGGSTSTDIFHTECWPAKLYRLMQRAGIECVIYNGAHEANQVMDEMIRLLRDIHRIRPDVVISMSGLNDSRRSGNKFESFHNEQWFDYWLQMESYMRTLAESEGARFFCFLQPINTCMEQMSLKESSFFETQSGDGKTFRKEFHADDGVIDLLTMFHHRDGLFFDSMHYTDTANEELAGVVFRKIVEELR